MVKNNMARYISFPIKDKSRQTKGERTGSFYYSGNLKYSSIYCLKALGAFFVICVHCFEPWQIFPIIRTAVPFFFIISGFFLYRENPDEAYNKCVNTFKKVFWITLYANIFYYLCYNVPLNAFPFKSIKSIIGFIAFGGSFGHHLWYLNAYLEALFIIIIFLKLRVLRYLWWCIPICMIFGLCTGKYEFLFPSLPNNLIYSRNFITTGIPCFGIGWLLKKYSCRLLEIFKYPILLTVILLLLSELEICSLKFLGHFLKGDYIITTFPLAASMVLAGVKYPLIGRNSMIEYVGKKYSTYIYIFHVFVLKTFLILNKETLGLPSITYPFIVFALTILFIIIWKRCSNKFF